MANLLLLFVLNYLFIAWQMAACFCVFYFIAYPSLSLLFFFEAHISIVDLWDLLYLTVVVAAGRRDDIARL